MGGSRKKGRRGWKKGLEDGLGRLMRDLAYSVPDVPGRFAMGTGRGFSSGGAAASTIATSEGNCV